MTKPQDKISTDDLHYEIRVIGDSNIFGQHENGGSEALGSIRNILYSDFGRDNVKSHTHSEPPYWKIKIREAHIDDLKTLVSNQNGLTHDEEIFQFKGISVKNPKLIDQLVSNNNRIEALSERNDDLISQLDEAHNKYTNIESRLTEVNVDYTRVKKQRDEARAAANNPPRRQVIVEPGKKEIPRLKREISDLEETLKNTKKLDKNIEKYFEYDEKYDNAANESLTLYDRAGIEIQIRDVKYLSPTEVLNRNTEFEDKKILSGTKTSLENKIRDIGNFTGKERETEMGNAEITNEYGEDVVRAYTLGELIDSEEIPDLFTVDTERYLPTKERIHQLTPAFGKKAKDVNKRLTRHFDRLRKLEKSGEHLGGIKEQIQYLGKIQEATEKHSEMIKYRSERDRIKTRIENG